LLRHPLERVDVVEISRGVINADTRFANDNYHALSDPRVHVYRDDGQSFLRAVPRRYDVIVSEPSNPWISGLADLFTREFFETLRDRLEPGGVAVVWFHEYEQSNESVEMVVRTVRSVFPHLMLWRDFDFSDVIIVASSDPLEPDFAAMEDRFDEPAILADFKRLRTKNFAAVLAHQAGSEEALARAVKEGPINTVSRQRLEYQAPRSFFLDERSNLLKRVDPLLDKDARVRDTLLDRYLAYRRRVGDPATQEELMDTARSTTSNIGPSILKRAEVAPLRKRPPTRPARGPVTSTSDGE
jgi:spermidine synthase